MVAEVGYAGRLAMRFDIIGGCTDDGALDAKPSSDEACLIAQFPEPDDEVEAFFYQINIAIREADIEIELGVLAGKRQQDGHDPEASKRYGQPNSQPPRNVATAGRQRRLRLFEVCQYTDAGLVIEMTVSSKSKGPRCAFEKAHSQMGFEPRDSLADGRF